MLPGLIIGAVLPFLFLRLDDDGCRQAAFQIVLRCAASSVRSRPDGRYGRLTHRTCVAISTQALREWSSPARWLSSSPLQSASSGR